MAIIIDDDDNEIDVSVDPDEVLLKKVIKQGVTDAEQIADTIHSLVDLAEPLGNLNELVESLIYYKEVVPNLLLGNYDYLMEGLDNLNQSERNLALATFKHTRKQMVEDLLEKYN